MASEVHVLFMVGDRRFALPGASVAEVLPLLELAVPPGLPGVLAGLLTLDRAAVPVLRADRLLGIDGGTPELDAHILRLRHIDPAMAMLVNRVTSVAAVPASDVRAVPAGQTFRDGVVAEIDGLDGPVHLISLHQLLSAAERRKLAEFQSAETRRVAAFSAAPIAEDVDG